MRKCRGCPHPPHLGGCTKSYGTTAYLCACTAQTPREALPYDEAVKDVVEAAQSVADAGLGPLLGLRLDALRDALATLRMSATGDERNKGGAGG